MKLAILKAPNKYTKTPGGEKRSQSSKKNKSTKTRSNGKVGVPTFLDFLRWLFLLDELGRLWKFQLLTVTSHLCNGLNAS